MTAVINKEAPTRQYSPGKFSNTTLSKKELRKRALSLDRGLAYWVPTFRDLSDYIYPTKGSFYTPWPNKIASKIDHTKLLDSHASLAVDIMASGMLSGLTSPSRPWFRLGLGDPKIEKIGEVKLWLDEATQILMDIFQKANIYGMLNNIYAEIGTFGTTCAYLEDDFEKVIRGRNYTAGEYAIGVNAKGVIDTFYRKFWLTVSQMVNRFGIENCSLVVQQAYNGNRPDEWRLIHHLIEPNNDRIPFLLDYSNMPFRTAYWEDNTEDDSYLLIGGYEEFPMLTPRWDTTTNADSYGKGPGWKALGSSKGLQQMVRNKLIAIEKQTNPPVQADASVIGEINTLPGGVTRYSAQTPNAGVKATYEVNLNIGDLDKTIAEAKNEIGRFFFTDLFLMMIEADRKGQPITATEVIERQAEKLSMLGPVLERLENELLNPLIERSFNIAVRATLIPRAPAEIEKQPLKIQYISVLAQAQRMQGVVAIDQFAQGIAADEALIPGSADIINFDAKNRHKADIMGIPEKILNTKEQIAQKRKAKAEEAEANERRLNMAAGAEAAAKGGKATKDLSEAEIGKNSALDSILAGISGQTGGSQ